jgi:hypothetical protein
MAAKSLFISYARKDAEFTLRLARDLISKGADLWVDQFDIRPGHPFNVEIDRALNLSTKIIVVLSASSVESPNVMDEVVFGLDQGKVVIPVLLDSCSIPYNIRRLQYIDFRSDYNSGLLKLVIALDLAQTEPISDAGVELILHIPGGEPLPAVAPRDIKIGTFIRDLQLPRIDPEGNRIEWVVEDKNLGRPIELDKTFQENGVRTGSHLYLSCWSVASFTPVDAAAEAERQRQAEEAQAKAERQRQAEEAQAKAERQRQAEEAAAKGPPPVRCTKCGTALYGNPKYCPSCGFSTGTEPGPPAPNQLLALRWVARVSGLFAAGLYAYWVVVRIATLDPQLFFGSNQLIVTVLLAATSAGMLIAWRRELLGAILSLISLALILMQMHGRGVVFYMVKGYVSPLPSLLLGAGVVAISLAAYVIRYLVSRPHNGASISLK